MHDEGPLWERDRERRERDGGGRRGSKRGKMKGKEGGREDRRKEGRRREGKKGRRAGGREGGSGGRTERECKEVRGLELEGLRKTICGCKQIWM